MEDRPAVINPNVWIFAIVLVAVVVGVVAALWMDRSGRHGSGLPERAQYQDEALRKIDPRWIGYEQTSEIRTGIEEARAVAVGPDDWIYVAGDQAIRVFDPGGALVKEVALPGPPTCLAVAGPDHAFPGRIYVGLPGHVDVLDAQGKRVSRWDVPGEEPKLTSIAVAPEDVFVADCAARAVLRYDTAGKLVGRIGGHDPERGIPGLVVPSPFLDVAVAPDGLVWVVNPGLRRLEAYSFDGASSNVPLGAPAPTKQEPRAAAGATARLEMFWGKGGTAGLDVFYGCCNPANFAFLPDGRFVTAEKGLLRVKVYTAQGQFECVVAGPEQLDVPRAAAGPSQFDQEYKAVDVAADSRGRVLILDLARAVVRLYEPRKPVSEEKDGETL